MTDQFYVPNSQKSLFANFWLWIIASLAIIAVITGVWLLVSSGSAPARGRLQARNQIFSAGNRITQYNHFFQLCAAAQTAEQNITQMRQQLAQTTDSQQRYVIQTNITANVGTRNDAVNTYNADASNSYDAGKFLASNLPYQLPTTIPEGGTKCTA